MTRGIFIFCTIFFVLTACTKQATNTKPEQNKDSKKIVVGIIPLNSIDQTLVDFSAKEVEEFYGVETRFMERKSLPDTLKKPYPKRYNANNILVFLNTIKPKDFDYLLGITDSKIATKKGQYKEWGILGLGQNPGPCCIVSTANMGNNTTRVYDRLSKVCLHEMGHNFGLPHCQSGDSLCLMKDANGTVKTVDGEKKYVCRYCEKFLTSKGFKITQQVQI